MKKQFLFLLFSLFVTACSSLNIEKDYGPRFASLGEGEKRSDHEAFGNKYMISTQGKKSSQIGEAVFRAGGNIVDVATAISFSLAVERPQSTGLGGGGFMLLHLKGMKKPIAVDFREKAPFAANSKMFLDEKEEVIKGKSINGIFAVGVPGMVAGILEVHQKYGKLPLKDLLAPAVSLAKKGFKIYPELAYALTRREKIFMRFPAAKKVFFKNESVLKKGDLLIQEDLGNTIQLIADNGRDGFYQGRIAKAIVNESQRLQGLLELKDFEKYNVKYRIPIEGNYRGHKIYSMSPPSSGGTHILQILNIVKNDDLKKLGPMHPRTIHLVGSAMQHAFRDRIKYMGDPDFNEIPTNLLLNEEYAKDTRKGIPERRALNRPFVFPGKLDYYREKTDKKKKRSDIHFYDSPETTHFSIMDSEGNAISSTQTLNGYFGSAIVVPGTGIVLNNEMDDFAAKNDASNLFGTVGGPKNLVEPEKRPLSSMSPTLVFKDSKPILSLGTPNGPRIITCVALTLLNYLEHDLSLYDSIATMRYHHQWSPDELRIENVPVPRYIDQALRLMEHKVEYKRDGCRVQAVALEKGKLHGVSDPRGFGRSIGE